MSERYTEVRSTTIGGIALTGRRTRAEMIAEWRRFHEDRLAESKVALSTPDNRLIVETYLGVYRRRDIEEVR